MALLDPFGKRELFCMIELLNFHDDAELSEIAEAVIKAHAKYRPDRAYSLRRGTIMHETRQPLPFVEGAEAVAPKDRKLGV